METKDIIVVGIAILGAFVSVTSVVIAVKTFSKNRDKALETSGETKGIIESKLKENGDKIDNLTCAVQLVNTQVIASQKETGEKFEKMLVANAITQASSSSAHKRIDSLEDIFKEVLKMLGNIKGVRA